MSLLGKIKYTATSRSPEIFFIGGCSLLIAAVIESGKARVKYEALKETLNKDLAEQQEYADKFDELKDANDLVDGESYTPAERKRDVSILKRNFAMKAAVVYIKTFVLCTASICCFAKSFGILNGWFLGVSSVASKLAKRNEFLEGELARLGKETIKEAKEIKYDDDGGEVKEDNDTSSPINDVPDDPFDRLFCESNPNFEKDPNRNMFWLDQKLTYAQYLFDRDGYLYLNDVYDLLGFNKTRAGQVYGWIKYKDFNEAKAHGHKNIISFGHNVDDNYGYCNKRFVEGCESAVWLHFNIEKEPIVRRVDLEDV